MKVTRVASNVLVEQTMSREQDGGEQRRGRTHGRQRTKMATHLTRRCAPLQSSSGSASDLPVLVTSGMPHLEQEKCICARVSFALVRMSIFFSDVVETEPP